MSDWAEEKARTIKARLDGEQGKVAAWIENRKLIEEQGPGLWKELRQRIVALVEDLNLALGKDALVIVGKDPNQMDVRFTVRHPSPQLLVWFEATTAQDALHWSYPGGRASDGKCSLVADASGILAFSSGGYSSTTDSIAKSMLDGLLREQ